MRKTWIVLLAGALALSGCADDGEETATQDTTSPLAQTPQTGIVSMDHGPGAGPQGCPAGSTSLSVVASNSKFNTDCLAGTPDQPLTLSFENKDQIGHNIVFLESHTATEVMFRAEIFAGPKTQTFTIAPQKPGSYAFHCEVHPTVMMGMFVVK